MSTRLFAAKIGHLVARPVRGGGGRLTLFGAVLLGLAFTELSCASGADAKRPEAPSESPSAAAALTHRGRPAGAQKAGNSGSADQEPAEQAQQRGELEEATAPASDSDPTSPSETGDDSARSANGSAREERAIPGSFPPPDPGPLHERTAEEGDGTWQPFDPRSTGSPLVYRLVVHPHPASRWKTLTVAAFDLGRLRVRHRPGTQDVKDTHQTQLLGDAGVVPPEDWESLVAVFNGGFQPRHGYWGIKTLGVELLPPQKNGCTIALLEGGGVAVSSWPKLEKLEKAVRSFRQTPPCLLEEGQLHPSLRRGNDRLYGGNHPERKTRRRSAVGLSKDGRTLFYALGSETEPRTLAKGLAAVGAHSAAQLDINWNWTRLFLFAGSNDDSAEKDKSEKGPRKDSGNQVSGSGPPIEVVDSLVPQMAKDRGEYLTRPSSRDFFYVVLDKRAALPE